MKILFLRVLINGHNYYLIKILQNHKQLLINHFNQEVQILYYQQNLLEKMF